MKLENLLESNQKAKKSRAIDLSVAELSVGLIAIAY